MNYVVESYENYKEENRLTTNNARKIEFLTTVKVLEKVIKPQSAILDCAAGTGVYAFWLAEKGHQVTATDITPRHVAVMNEELEKRGLDITTAVLDATDMSVFQDETFDVVLNMGPFYHLLTEELREKCLRECLRVLKKGGLLVTAYIPRYYVLQYLAMSDAKYLDGAFVERFMASGALSHEDEKCFWTDSYYATAEEMELMYRQNGLAITEHFAQDGLTPLFSKKADGWTQEEFKVWCDYHYSVCREKSLLGSSNHVIIIGRKE